MASHRSFRNPPPIDDFLDMECAVVMKKSEYLYFHLIEESSFEDLSDEEYEVISSDESVLSDSSYYQIVEGSCENNTDSEGEIEIDSDSDVVCISPPDCNESNKVLKITNNDINENPKKKNSASMNCSIAERTSDSNSHDYHNSLRNKGLNMKRKLSNEIFSPNKSIKQEDERHFNDVEETFGEFRCRVCNITVHSEVTLQTHLVGKRHMKTLRTSAVAEVALQSLAQNSRVKTMPSKDRYPDGNDRYPPPAPGMKRIKLNKIASLQTVIDRYKKGPIIGLNCVIEIKCDPETLYYCELCNSPCSVASIMCHLIGFKHRLNCVRKFFPALYEKIHTKQKKEVERKIIRILFDYEKSHGRELIQVEKEVKDTDDYNESEYVSSRRESQVTGYSHNKSPERNVIDISWSEDLDTSKSDFYCKLCDSHMNNKNMWEAHIRGKRHLVNKKKCPGESPSKKKTRLCRTERAHLLSELKHIREPIVGLDYIRETQRHAGDQYNCFICGACCTNYDIIDHILSEKHRKKYLETILKEGKPNEIEAIIELTDISNSARQNLIASEAERIQQIYGKGRIEVHKSKDIYPEIYGLS